jgi:hypothetical protein
MSVCLRQLPRLSGQFRVQFWREKDIRSVHWPYLLQYSLYGSKDQPCHETFQLKAEPIKRLYAKGEPITIRLSFTNSTSHDVYIVPYLFPSDYWVDKHGDGRWIALSTGISGPNAKERPAGSTDPTQRIIKGRPFEVSFECEAKLYRKEHPYEH